jgi:hypothetical protein
MTTDRPPASEEPTEETCNHPVYNGFGDIAGLCNQPKGHGDFHGLIYFGEEKP